MVPADMRSDHSWHHQWRGSERDPLNGAGVPVGILLTERGPQMPLRSAPFACGDSAAVFFAEVTHERGPGPFQLSLELEHKDPQGTTWSTAGSFGDIFGSASSTMEIAGLKRVLRWIARFEDNSAGDFFRLSLGTVGSAT